MNIHFLVNHPDKINEVSFLIFKEFVVKSGSRMQFEDVVKHFSNTKVNTFPVTLVSLEDGECLGTVSIVENDLRIRDMYKPWLSSLYTKPAYRGRGVGEKLIAATRDAVNDLGFNELYLRTEDASDYYRKRGWTYLETVSDEKYEKIDVFKLKCM
ncbi:GNAT family N-acetyltransferase [Oceanobacillus sp. FSL H7-0719]|uniref:GNAT family N-acetyltransferase n=1 Tax=Oceanobacillus sp. FSL H7-0719 TaxID=2954507 RepID=UPI0032521C1A